MTTEVSTWPRGTRRRYAAGPLGQTRSGGDSRRVGEKVDMSQVGKLLRVSVSSRYEDGFGGTDLISWTIQPNGGFIGGIFRPGDHCRVEHGGGVVGEGEISEVLPQPDGTVEFNARGYAYNLTEYHSLFYNEDYVPSRTDGTAPLTSILTPSTILAVGDPNLSPGVNRGGWEYAVADLGMPINEVVGTVEHWDESIGLSAVAQRILTVGEVLTARERLNGRRWAVWGRTLFLVADPTEPMWRIDAPEGSVGVADTDYYTHVGIWYRWWNPTQWDAVTLWAKGSLVSGFDGKWYVALVDVTGGSGPGLDTDSWEETQPFVQDWMTTVDWQVDEDGLTLFDHRDTIVDYRGAGLNGATSPTVGEVAGSLIEQVKGRFIFTGSFTVGPDGGLTSAAGGKAPIAFVRAGQGLQIDKLRTTQGNLIPSFVTIGRTEWEWQNDETEQLTVVPMGAVPRDFGSILAGIPYSDPPAVA